jgi:hypothetical protein
VESETTHDDISDDLRARLQDLARVHDVEPGDLRDEHERWALYDLTMRREAGLSRLFDLLPMEPEAARSEEVASGVDDWSDWLQRRITVHVEDVAVLEIMAERGRTKRVRRQAAEALRDLRP